jgi:large subunit ribosomal protein L4
MIKVQQLDVKRISGYDVDESTTTENHQIYLTIKDQNASMQQHTAHTKTRSEVNGGGAKPYRQKGTGRARRGTNRSPLRRGGGVIFGPRFKTVSHKVNKKVKRAAIVSLFKAKADVLQEITYESTRPMTKELREVFNANKRISLIVDNVDEMICLAARNFKNVHMMTIDSLQLQDIACSESVYVTSAVVSNLEGLQNDN